MQISLISTFIWSKISRPRTLVSLLAVAGLIAIVTISAVNTAATPRSVAEVRMAGWVNTLKTEKLTAERQQAQRNLEAAGEAALPQLLTALTSDSATQRRNAADLLGFIASPQATQALRDVLRQDAVPAVRRNAAWALGEIKAPSAINDLQQASITDRSSMVRGAAADSLARIRSVLAKSAQVNEHFVGAYASAPSTSDTLYVAVKRDLVTSTDGGTTWKTLSNAFPSQVSALAVNPDNARELYAGIEGLGIYKSGDAGATWKEINTGISLTPGARETIAAIAIDPADPHQIYIARGVWVGTGTVNFYPIGLLVTYDGGMTWQTLTAGASASAGEQAIERLAFRDGQLYGLVGDRVLTLVTPH